jgi:hypothetical protein
VAGFKRLEDFKKLLAKFEELERTHESDNYIDKTYYLLNDLITEV